MYLECTIKKQPNQSNVFFNVLSKIRKPFSIEALIAANKKADEELKQKQQLEGFKTRLNEIFKKNKKRKTLV